MPARGRRQPKGVTPCRASTDAYWSWRTTTRTSASSAAGCSKIIMPPKSRGRPKGAKSDLLAECLLSASGIATFAYMPQYFGTVKAPFQEAETMFGIVGINNLRTFEIVATGHVRCCAWRLLQAQFEGGVPTGGTHRPADHCPLRARPFAWPRPARAPRRSCWATPDRSVLRRPWA
jgi:hypothetical protein